MARLISRRAYPTFRLAANIDLGHLLLTAFQWAVLGGIGLYVALIIVNTILGTPQPDTTNAG